MKRDGGIVQSYAVKLVGVGDVGNLTIADFEPRSPGQGELLVRNTAIGLNFAEVYLRIGQSGPHQAKAFPIIPGSNGAGEVIAVGDGVHDFKRGDRVAYIAPNAYATHTVIPAHRAVSLPTGMSEELAAASFLRGLTAEYLTHRLFRVESGMDCLVHASAGGVGQLLAQWIAALGARVIGTAGGKAKAEIARANGCAHVIDYRQGGFAGEVLRITNGVGVHVVYDGVGRDVFFESLECLRVRGIIASYGAASGPVAPLDIQLLHEKALFVTRPTLRSYIVGAEMLRASAARFFAAIYSGAVTPRIDQQYALKDVGKAHFDLETRALTGSAVLIP